MENRERDRVSQRDTPTEAGQVNKRTEEERMRDKSASSAEFGSSIGRSENLEGGEMDRNKNREDSSMGNEYTRRPSGDFDSSTGRSGPVGNKDLDREDSSTPRSGSKDRPSDSGIGDSSSGRH
jgi:hypothetical protein